MLNYKTTGVPQQPVLVGGRTQQSGYKLRPYSVSYTNHDHAVAGQSSNRSRISGNESYLTNRARRRDDYITEAQQRSLVHLSIGVSSEENRCRTNLLIFHVSNANQACHDLRCGVTFYGEVAVIVYPRVYFCDVLQSLKLECCGRVNQPLDLCVQHFPARFLCDELMATLLQLTYGGLPHLDTGDVYIQGSPEWLRDHTGYGSAELSGGTQRHSSSVRQRHRQSGSAGSSIAALCRRRVPCRRRDACKANGRARFGPTKHHKTSRNACVGGKRTWRQRYYSVHAELGQQRLPNSLVGPRLEKRTLRHSDHCASSGAQA